LLLFAVVDVLQVAVIILGCCYLSFLIKYKATCIKYRFYYLLLYFFECVIYVSALILHVLNLLAVTSKVRQVKTLCVCMVALITQHTDHICVAPYHVQIIYGVSGSCIFPVIIL
jgi:hypothetical protein